MTVVDGVAVGHLFFPEDFDFSSGGHHSTNTCRLEVQVRLGATSDLSLAG